MTDETFPEDMAAPTAYSNWRSESNRAERELYEAALKIAHEAPLAREAKGVPA